MYDHEAAELRLSDCSTTSLSKRNLLLAGFNAWIQNPFHTTTNVGGIINLGTAENKLLHMELSAKLNSIVKVTPETLNYGRFDGLLAFRDEVAALFNRKFRIEHAPLNNENIMITNGCSAAMSVITQVLCNKGDGVLVHGPLYGGFDFDLCNAAGATIVKVMPESADLTPTRADLEEAYAAATAKGITIKYLLICNPYNPIGIVFSTDTIRMFLDFAASKQIHTVVDEIYAFSVWGGEAGIFNTVLALDDIPDPSRTHCVWGMSKDFGLSGMRVGCIITRSAKVINACRTYAHTSSIPHFLETALTEVLHDKEFVDTYIETYHLKLRQTYEKLTSALTARGIPYVPASAGFFLWTDFSAYIARAALRDPSASNGEEALFNMFIKSGLYIARGAAFFDDKLGWFRILFASQWNEMQLALDRIFSVLSSLDAMP